MSRFLEKLETNLLRTSPATAELVGSWLEENMISFQHMANSLAEHIPAVMTLPVAFSPGASENGIIATLEDIAMRVHCDRCSSGLAPVMTTPQVLMPKIYSTRRPSLGSVLVKSVQVFSNSSAFLHAAAHGERAAQRMSLLMLSTTFISSIWRGYVARQRTFHLRAMRDAAMLIAWHTREWLKRRRQRMAAEAEQEQSPTASEDQPGALDWGLSRRRALSRLREARMRHERAMQLRRQAMGSSDEDDGDELQDADTAFALLIIASYARCWLGHHAAARAASRRQALEEEAAAAVLEEERLKKKASMEPIAITPELHEAKQHMRNRARCKSSSV